MKNRSTNIWNIVFLVLAIVLIVAIIALLIYQFAVEKTVDPADVETAMEAIRAAGDTPYVVGYIKDGETGVTLC